MSDEQASLRRIDPLEGPRSRRLVVLATLAVMNVAFLLSAQRRDPDQLPGIALDSPFLLDLERAAVVGAVVASVLIFSIRGWRGYFPSKLSTGGAEYGALPSVTEVSESSEEVRSALEDLKARQAALARATRQAFSRVEKASDQADDDDML